MIEEETSGTGITATLTADHARLDGLFDEACRLAASGDLAGARRSFDDFSRGLSHHIGVEERSLFPAFDARVRMPGPTMVMRHEHRTIEELLAVAQASLAAGDGGTFARRAAELAAILRAHNLKEERVLYPRSDAALDEHEQGEIVAALRRG